MTVKKIKELLKIPRAYCMKGKQRVKTFLEERTARQKYIILAVLYCLFLLADVWMLVQGFSHESSGIDHIEPVNIVEHDTD